MSGWESWGGDRRWIRHRGWQSMPAPSATSEPLANEPVGVDEFGLSLALYRRFPRDVRYFVSLALDHFRLPKDEPPQQVGFGTIPELCFYGLLLEAGFTPTSNGFFGQTPRSFLFQSRVLGGRVPGGAVADFVVFINARAIAVRVQSVFHDEQNPFGSGGAKSEEDRRQFLRLRSASYLDNVVDVNRAIDGHPLENGPGALIREELRRVMVA